MLEEDYILECEPSIGLQNVVIDAIMERLSQIHEKGFDELHDDNDLPGDLAMAGIVYALLSVSELNGNTSLAELAPQLWPWKNYYKPKTLRENLIRSIALLVAEVERVDRNGTN